jgi:hypothetical protein
MGKYDAYLVCENGHGINDSYYKNQEFNKAFCTTCGASTFKSCPNCKSDIEGDYHVENVFSVGGGPTPVPDICKHCGKDFPWRSKKKLISKTVVDTAKDDILLLETIMDRFHLVVKQIRQRYNERATLDVKDEYDTQDLMHSLLRLYYDDIRAEEWNPSYGGGSTRSDFLLKNEKIVLEIKKTRSTLKTKQLGEQLIIDIAKYKTHPDCKLLYCFVYDPEGYVTNPRGLENDLNDDSKEMKVKVKIIPKGH